LTKMGRYAGLWAREAAGTGRGCGVGRALAKAAGNMFKTLVLRLGVLDGPYGWAVCAVSGYYTLSKYLILSGLAQKERK
jgi:(heptosyl)LPS beta-1,4-glucosyltransferase